MIEDNKLIIHENKITIISLSEWDNEVEEDNLSYQISHTQMREKSLNIPHQLIDSDQEIEVSGGQRASKRNVKRWFKINQIHLFEQNRDIRQPKT